MRLVTYRPPKEPTLIQRLFGATERPAYFIKPLNMAHALIRSGRTSEAKSLSGGAMKWSCIEALAGAPDVLIEPWEQTRVSALKQAAQVVCPQQPRAMTMDR